MVKAPESHMSLFCITLVPFSAKLSMKWHDAFLLSLNKPRLESRKLAALLQRCEAEFPSYRKARRNSRSGTAERSISHIVMQGLASEGACPTAYKVHTKESVSYISHGITHTAISEKALVLRLLCMSSVNPVRGTAIESVYIVVHSASGFQFSVGGAAEHLASPYGWRGKGLWVYANISVLVMSLQVNKPYLPLASGEFSMATALAIVSICGIAALVIGVLVGSFPLMLTLVGSAVLGLAYSVDLPFLRWKRSPVLAACCILAVR